MARRMLDPNTVLDYVSGIVGGIAFFFLLIQWGFKLSQGYEDFFRAVDAAVLLIFLCEAVLRFMFTPVKKDYIKHHAMDLIVLIPGIQFVLGIHTARFFVVIRQVLVMFSLFSRTKRLQRLVSLLSLKPAQMLMVSFAITILSGAFLLTLPIASRSGTSLNFVDALFTATSATCVTGLTVKDTGAFFSLFGQLVILALIQIGALGIMTFSVTVVMAAGKKISKRETMTMQDVLDQDSIAGIIDLIWFIAKMTLVFEGVGAAFLFFGFHPYIPEFLPCLYAAVFHAVSAFCNAGFSLFGDNLMRYVRDPVINLTICVLIIAGGLGFIVVKDVLDKYVKHLCPRGIALKLHTKLVLSMTLVLIGAGTAFLFFAENHYALRAFPLSEQLLVSFFHAVSARTAGFNTIDIGAMTNASIFSLIILMFIGASSGSTGGGIKTTTFWIILKAFSTSIQGKEEISAFKRKIPQSVLLKSVAVCALSLGLVIIFMYLISMCENLPFRDLLFEVVSAFGTVGLSTGITASLHDSGKLLITLLMYLGRLGPLTVVFALARSQRQAQYSYAEEKVMVG